MNAQARIKGNIVIVDDNATNLRLLADILEAEGYTVRPATSGRLALRAINTALPDLVLLDLGMPDLSGYEVCNILKSNPKTQFIPIIFISGFEQFSIRSKAFEIGGSDYITKPFVALELLMRIKNQLNLSFLEQQLIQKTEELNQQKKKYSEIVASFQLFIFHYFQE